jgi:hypothetical protein
MRSSATKILILIKAVWELPAEIGDCWICSRWWVVDEVGRTSSVNFGMSLRRASNCVVDKGGIVHLHLGALAQARHSVPLRGKGSLSVTMRDC